MFLYQFTYTNIRYIKVLNFLIIFSLLWIKIENFKFFKAFNLLSNDILLVTDEGIENYNPETNEEKPIINITLFDSSGQLSYITFAQFSEEEGGYILCRIQDTIFFIKNDALTLLGSIQVNGLTDKYIQLIPYLNKEDKYTFITCLIGDGTKLNIYMHEINLSSFNESKLLYHEAKNIIYSDGTYGFIGISIVACKLLNTPNEKNMLTCFLSNSQNYGLDILVYDQNNNFSSIYAIKSTVGISDIKFITIDNSPSKNISLVCYMESSTFKCSLYYPEKKEWGNIVTYLKNCNFMIFERSIQYIREQKENVIYCYKGPKNISFIQLDEEFNIKEFGEEGKCITNFIIEECYSMHSSSFIFNKNKNLFNIITQCQYTQLYEFKQMEINYECSEKIIDSTIYQTSIISSNSLLKTDNYNTNFISQILTTSLGDYSTIIIPSTFQTLISSTSTSISTTPSTFPSEIPLSSSLLESDTISQLEDNFSISNLSSIISNIPNSEFSSEEKEESFISSIPDYSTISNSVIKSIDYIQFYNKGDIIKGKTNITKEKMEENLKEIINIIEIGKKYIINGDDYNMTISPINVIDTFQSTYVELSICEQILRKQYNLSSNEILTILQIEIDKKNEKALTNQVEYGIYDKNKNNLDLSYCKGVPIKVNYEIKDASKINKTMVSYYSEKGIDIFNSNDSFFNDICYAYSEGGSDIILKDRVLDIYQNFSLCDTYCTYNKIDIENMSVSCSCDVKLEIDMEVSEPAFGTIIEDSFKDSNFGVIFCYNLVFSLDYKLNNVGFLIFLILVIIHIILFLSYFCKGINPIITYVHKEMGKYNYITKYFFPPKKRKKLKGKKIEISKNQFTNSYNNILKEKGEKNGVILNALNQTKDSGINVNPNLQNIKLNNPIVVVKYDYKFYNINNKVPLKSKKIIKNIYKKNRTKKEKYNNNNKDPKKYYLIQINADNEKNNEPPPSKYILDNYDYENALKYDKRIFWRIYYIILLSKENILNTFFFKAPLEIQSLRLSIFIFSYSCDFALNALFYLNDNISDKYHYQGENLYWFTLVNNLTISIFSTVISYLLVKTLNILTNSKDAIELLFRKQEKLLRKSQKYKVKIEDKKEILKNLGIIYKTLKIKIIFYISIEFSFLLFFLYYITAFCEVFKNTQISWLYDSFISFLLSIPIELLLSFTYALLYMTSINYRFETLYNIVLFFYGIG